MKKMLCLFFILAMLLTGCSTFGARIKDPVTFYYLCDAYTKEMCCVILPEERESSGHEGDLSYLLALYLMGPISEDLHSPLPSGTVVQSVQNRADGVWIVLSDLDKSLSDAEFSLAGACLTMTCLDIVSSQNVTVLSGTRSVTMNHSSLSLYDGVEEDTQKEATQ